MLQFLFRVAAWVGAAVAVWGIGYAALSANSGFNGSWNAAMPVFREHISYAAMGLAVWAVSYLIGRKWFD
jgi:hypothetical protein